MSQHRSMFVFNWIYDYYLWCTLCQLIDIKQPKSTIAGMNVVDSFVQNEKMINATVDDKKSVPK